MEIKIDKEKATEKLNAGQLRASVRIVSFEQLCYVLEFIESRLSDVLFRSDWYGLSFEIDIYAKDFARSYHNKGTPQSTTCIVTFKRNGWVVDEVYRDNCKVPSKKIQCLNMDTKKEELAKFISNYKSCFFC